MCGTPKGLSSGSTYPLDNLPPDLPTKCPPRRCSPATSHQEKSAVGPVVRLKPAKCFSPQGFKGFLSVRSPTTFQEARRVPAFPHQKSQISSFSVASEYNLDLSFVIYPWLATDTALRFRIPSLLVSTQLYFYFVWPI